VSSKSKLLTHVLN